jgi:hypothetical protein
LDAWFGWQRTELMRFLLLLAAAACCIGGAAGDEQLAALAQCDAVDGALAATRGGPPKSKHAYMIMIGPLGQGHSTWLLAAVAVFAAMRQHGSTADFVLLCAVRETGSAAPAAAAGEEPRITDAEEARLAKVRCDVLFH